MAAPRAERILWLGFRLVSVRLILSWSLKLLISQVQSMDQLDHDSQTFSVARHATELSETFRPRRGSTPSNLQTSNDEDTIMIDINAAGDSSDRVSKGSLFTPEPRSDTPTSSLTKDNKP